MGSEGVTLSEMSQRKTNTVWYHLCVESTEKQQTTEYNNNKKKQTHWYRKQTSGYPWGEGRGEGMMG